MKAEDLRTEESRRSYLPDVKRVICLRALCTPSTLVFGMVAGLTSGPAAPAQTQQTTPPLLSATPPAPASAPDAPAHARDSASLPAPPSPYRITGVVVDSVTKSVIPNATLSAEPMNTVSKTRAARRRFQSQSNSAMTDSAGHFDLSVPSAGGWSLTADARGYRAQPLDEHDGYSTAVILTQAAPNLDVTFRLTPASIIEGFVLDEAGEAVRGANVALLYLPPPTPDDPSRRPRSRSQQTTDDRGFYKFAALGPGSYQVRVTARPWYATATARSRPTLGGQIDQPDVAPGSSAPDPLDVVYPTVWYPGATDPSAATPIALNGGETQEANFRLLPMPSSHLRIAASSSTINSGEQEPRPQGANAYLTRLLPDGTEDAQQTPTRMDAHGNADIGGLAPGTYLVHQQTFSTGATSLSVIQIGAGSARTVDVSEGLPAANVTVQVDPAADLDSLQITFRDLETGHTSYAQRVQDMGRRPLRGRGQAQHDSPEPESPPAKPGRTVSLPPGRYEVVLSGIGNVHLARIDAIGGTATGRIVTIGAGAPKLFLHTAKGLGTVIGIVSLQGHPLPGAMVMLIPASLGNPSGLDMPSRDQSNTDGSFEMSGLLPGGYILIAIDHGWEVNWSDPSTLRRYLPHGTPVDIQPGSDLKETIDAQSP